MFRSLCLLAVSLTLTFAVCSNADAEVVLAVQNFDGDGYNYGYRFAGYGEPGTGNVDYTASTPLHTNSVIGGESVTDWDMDFQFPTPNDYTYLGIGVGGGISPGDGFLNTSNTDDLEISMVARLDNVVGTSSVSEITVQFFDAGSLVSEYRLNGQTLQASGSTFTESLSSFTLNAGSALAPGNIGGIDQIGMSIQATDATALGQGSPGIRSIAMDNFSITNVTAIPEPSSATFLLATAVGGLCMRRKRKKSVPGKVQ